MPWLEVECPNETCPGREVAHDFTCACGGSGRILRDDSPGTVDCDAGEEQPLRWEAFYYNTTLAKPGEWHNSIHCPSCGFEGEEVG